MSKTAIYFTIIIIILIVLLALYFVYMNSTSNYPTTINNNPAQTSTTSNTIKLGSSASLGSFLIDANGKTLYYFANDINGKSNCTGVCSTIWKPFYASNIIVPSDLNVTDFGQITNIAGTNQTTYKGWPLYYYSGDNNSGDTNGQSVQNIWFVASSPFYNVLLMNNTNSKTYLSNVNGEALYYFKSDTRGSSTTDPVSKCTGTCLNTWTIFDQSQVVAPVFLSASDFTKFTRVDNTTQLAYKGYPLYLYSGDTQSGDIKGDGLNKLWYLVKP